MFAVGDVVAGRYEVLASLGQRPLGWLYRAREREIGVEVALRVLGSDILPDEASRQSFVQRVGRARSFSHPHLVRVFGVYPTIDDIVIASQWAPGTTLQERIQERALTPEEARPLVAQAAMAFTHAHQHGVVLGDVHAATVVLLGQVLKISNVGIGPALPRKRFLEATRDSGGYSRLPPEMRSGMTADTRADVFSLGMLLVEMLTGGADPKAKAILEGPKTLQTVLGRAMADDPLVRHASIDALAQELEAALGGQPARPRRATLPPMGVPLKESTSDRHRVAPPEPRRETTGQAPSPDEVRHPAQETTRNMPEDELALYKGDQVTRQIPQEELFPLRMASSSTQPFEKQMIVEEDDYAALELNRPTSPPAAAPPAKTPPPATARPTPPPATARPTPPATARPTPPPVISSARPPSLDPTDQVPFVEVDNAQTAEVPRLVDNNSPPPVEDDFILPADEIDTARVKKVIPNAPGFKPATLETLTPLPPPLPASHIPLPPSAAPAPPPADSIPISLADSPDVPTSVEPGGAPRDPSAARPSEPAPPVAAVILDEPLYGTDEDDRTSDPNAATRAAVPSALPSAAPVPLPHGLTPTPTPLPPSPAAMLTPEPELLAPGRAKRRNPFDPPSVDEELPTAERQARSKRRSPFDPVDDEGAPGSDTVDGKKRMRKAPPTELVGPIGRRPSMGTTALVALVAFVSAVGLALAVSRWMAARRADEDRLQRQRVAEELRVKAEEAKAKASAPPSVTAPPVVASPHSEPLDTVLPRSGPCPLGAKLVGSGAKAFCIDAYEYPGGNTIPRVSVSFSEASHICAARGERMCGEGEWERACRGKGGASFPYGNAFDAARCNTRGASGDVAPSGKFAQCKSGAGVYDMSGNVAEWVASGAQKGGSVHENPKEARCSAVVRSPAKEGSVYVGFRCCADPSKH